MDEQGKAKQAYAASQFANTTSSCDYCCTTHF